jgi:hypothetical protein
LEIYVPTYPHVQLESLQQIVNDFQLGPNALIDLWKGEWTTIHPNTPISVDNGRRILLRMRPSLRVSLVDCPGMENELRLQPCKPVGTKRQSECVSPLKGPSAKHVKSRRMLESIHASSSCAVISSDDSDSELVLPKAPGLHASTSRPISSLPRRAIAKQSSITPPSKKWPFDRYACEIHDGWVKINQMMAEDPKMTQQEAFPIVFGIQYKKTTVCKYKLQWSDTPQSLRDKFVAFGKSSHGSYMKFDKARQALIRHCEGNDSDSDQSVIVVKNENEEPRLSVDATSEGKWKEVVANGKIVVEILSDSD